MSTDLTESLSALRPAPTLEPVVRDAMLTAILHTDRSGPGRQTWSPRRRRVVVGASLAGLAAAAAIVVPTVLPSSTPLPALGHASPAAAAELRRLAVVVEHHRPITLGPHQYLYIAESEVQRGLIGYQVRGTSLTQRQGWTSSSGRLWRRDDTTDPIEGHRVDTYVIAPNDDDSPEYLATLPTEPAALQAYLRSRYGSSPRGEQFAFEQIEFVLQTGIAPASLRSAALQVLAETDGVTVTQNVRDSLGRPAERFTLTYRSQGRTGVESVYLDPSNARVLETSSDFFDTTFVDTVEVERVVDSVPSSVRRDASAHR